DDMNLEIDNYNTLPYSPLGDGNFNPSTAVQGGKIGFDNLAFNVGLRFIKHQEFIPYISYSQGFSIADMGSVLRSATAENINDIQLEPAVTKNYEFGFLSKFQTLKLEAVAYYSKIGRASCRERAGTCVAAGSRRKRPSPSAER